MGRQDSARTSVGGRLVLISGMYQKMFAATELRECQPFREIRTINGVQTLIDLQYKLTR